MPKPSFFPFLLAAILLTGCSSTPEMPTSVEWRSHQSQLKQVESFKAVGKLSYLSPEKKQSLSFYWQHSQENSQLRLTTFLGQTALKLDITPEGAVIETYDDDIFTAESASSLVYRLTGLLIPVEHMPAWMLGMPNEADWYQLNEINTLASLTKRIGLQPWQLDYTQYKDVQFNGLSLPMPRKMTLQQETTKIKLAISKWTLAAK